MLAILGLVMMGARATDEFEGFMRAHGKQYADAEEQALRREVWADNREYVRRHNAEGHRYALAMNQFGDYTTEEFRVVMLHDQARVRPPPPHQLDAIHLRGEAGFDWRDRGVVTPVKNQGPCGSCWAFAATEAVESANAIANGLRVGDGLVPLSPQTLVNCVDDGCQGGFAHDGFDYIAAHGLCTAASVPYAPFRQTCEHLSCAVGIEGWQALPQRNEDRLRQYVQTRPVAVAIEASLRAFQFYASGVFDNPECGTDLDHAVVVVGWGEANGTDYWTVRNSWSETWGEGGYIRIERGSNRCGIAETPTMPLPKTAPAVLDRAREAALRMAAPRSHLRLVEELLRGVGEVVRSP